MVEEKKKKPTFLRRDWQKKIKFGKTVKKNRKWRAAKGRQNKIRLGVKGYSARPKIGYSENNAIKNKINGCKPNFVTNLKELNLLDKGSAVIIADVGTKKRTEMLKICSEKGLVVLNKYKKTEKK